MTLLILQQVLHAEVIALLNLCKRLMHLGGEPDTRGDDNGLTRVLVDSLIAWLFNVAGVGLLDVVLHRTLHALHEGLQPNLHLTLTPEGLL